MLTERIVDVHVLLKRQIQYLDTCPYDPNVQKTMFQTTRLQEIAKFLQVTVIDEVMQRQVLTIWEMEMDQKPEEVQISFKVYVNRVKDGESDIYEPREAGQSALLVLASMAGRTKLKCRKTRTSVHQCEVKYKAPRERVQRAAADETVPEEMETRKRAGRAKVTQDG